MVTVVNMLRFVEPVDPALFERAEVELGVAMRSIDGFRGFQVVHTGESEVVLLIFGDTVETPARHVGPVIASATG